MQVTVKEKLLYNAADSPINKTFPVANACLQDALHDFKMAKKNKNAIILDSRDKIKNKEINHFLVKAGVPKDSNGVYYNSSSKEAQTIANSKEIKDYISKNYKNLINKNAKTQKLMNFTSDKNLQYAIQHCTLVNPKITEDGYFEGTIVDYYDYKHIEGKGFGVDLNNWGHSMQERGLLKNYYIVFSIRVKI